MRTDFTYTAPSLPTMAEHRRDVADIVDAKLKEAEMRFRHLGADGDRSGTRDRIANAMDKLGEWKARLV